MSDGADRNDHHGSLDRRRADLAGGEGSSGGGAARLLAGAALVVVIGAGGAMILMPGEVRGLFGGDPSEAEDMQTVSDDTTGVSTEITVEQPSEAEETVETDTATIPPEADDGAAERARIADLEAQIEALEAASGGQSAEDIRALLKEQSDTLKEQFERERDHLEDLHQQALRDATTTTPVPAGVSFAGAGGDAEAEAEARRRLEEERARRAEIEAAQIASDGIVLDASGRVTGSTSAGGSAGAGGASGDGGGRPLTSNETFIEEASARSYDTVSATEIADPSRTIVQGATIAATLETAIDSEMPGLIRAVVTDDVYSFDGTNVLLPRGTQLVGSYNSGVASVQDRVQLAWSRAVTPEGVSVELGGFGADSMGRSGQAGRVNSRFGRRFGSAALVSLLGRSSEAVAGPGMGATGQGVADDLGGDLQSSARGSLEGGLGAPPVISIDQGTAVTVIVNRDLVF